MKEKAGDTSHTFLGNDLGIRRGDSWSRRQDDRRASVGSIVEVVLARSSSLYTRQSTQNDRSRLAQ